MYGTGQAEQLRSSLAAVLLCALVLLSCNPDDSRVDPPDLQGDLETIPAALTQGPLVVIESPSNFLYIRMQDQGPSPVQMVVSTANWSPFPSPGKALHFYLDDQLIGESDWETTFTYPDVPMGQHPLTVIAVQDGQELAIQEARATRYVRMTLPCQNHGDCDDGNPCTVQACIAGSGGQSECHWGFDLSRPGCCATGFDCPFDRPVCGDLPPEDGIPECVQCLGDQDCDDGNLCTGEVCVQGSCQYTISQGECSRDQDCDDGNSCSQEQCSVETCQCLRTWTPGCCSSNGDCDDGNPCTMDRCVGQTCRHGPAIMGQSCCTSDADCPRPDPCSLGTCHLEPGAQTGTCQAMEDPDRPGCCTSDGQCEGLLPKFLGRCKQMPAHDYLTCGFQLNPQWCEQGSWPLVINEVSLGTQEQPSWIELHNPSVDQVSLAGATLAGPGFICDLQGAAQITSHGFLLVASGEPDQPPGEVLLCPQLNLAQVQGRLDLQDQQGVLLDSLEWPSPGIPQLELGRSLSLASPQTPQETRIWKPGTRDSGSWGLGTPGAPNLDLAASPDPDVCRDDDPCTLDLCSRNEANFCAHLPREGCCSSPVDCSDKDPCTLDQCIEGRCSFSPIPGCCRTQAECDDQDDCTLDACVNHFCRHGPVVLGSTCCHDVDDCDDGDPCTDEVCDKGLCTWQDRPGCCNRDRDCLDQSLCTLDLCDRNTNTCTNPPIEGCCLTDEDCEQAKEPEQLCRPGKCLNHRCRLTAPLPGCCASVQDCDDSDPCTADLCDPGTATCINHLIREGCCDNHSDCPDSDQDPCTRELCLLGTCTSLEVQSCCAGPQECDDQDDCTTDLCLDQACRHVPLPPGQCCTLNSDCPPDTLACTRARCGEDGTCTHPPISGCALLLPHQELFPVSAQPQDLGWTLFEPGEGNWNGSIQVTGEGPLGPDGHLRISRTTPGTVCALSPRFNFSQLNSRVGVAFESQAQVQEGFLRMEVSALVGEDWISLSKREGPGWQIRVEHMAWTPPPGEGGFILAICLFSPAEGPALLDVDRFAIAHGSSPEWVDPIAGISARPGSHRIHKLLARDTDWLGGAVPRISLSGGPRFAFLGSTGRDPRLNLFTNRLHLDPPAAALPSTWSNVKLEVSDGYLFDRMDLVLDVTLETCLQDEDCNDENLCTQDTCQNSLCIHATAAPCCGNGEVEPGEQCDDLDSIPGDGCSATCLLEDNDQDGLFDLEDNCPWDPNPEQLDQDQDTVGDLCDLDLEGDGVPNDQDNCPVLPNTGQLDSDGDLSGDACDPDDDNDGVDDEWDNCSLQENPGQEDLDQDGLGDPCDPDDDGDGLLDGDDSCPGAWNPTQEDLDQDGLGDACDPDVDGDSWDQSLDCDDLTSEIHPRWTLYSRTLEGTWRLGTTVRSWEDLLLISGYPSGEALSQVFEVSGPMDNPGSRALTQGPGGAVPVALDQSAALWQDLDTGALWFQGEGAPVLIPEGPGGQSEELILTQSRVFFTSGEGLSQEIYLWSNGETTRLTDNSKPDHSLAGDQGRLVWESGGEIYLWDGEQQLLTSDQIWDQEPRLFGQTVVWTRRNGQAGRGNIMTLNLTNGAREWLIQDDVEDRSPVIGPLGTAWIRCPESEADCRVMFRGNGASQPIQLSTEPADEIEEVFIGDDHVTWSARTGDHRDLVAWDGNQVQILAKDLPVSVVPSFSSLGVAWLDQNRIQVARLLCTGDPDQDGDGEDSHELGGTDCDDDSPTIHSETMLINLSQGSLPMPSPPSISDGRVVWHGFDGNDFEIFLYDGRGVIQLTDNLVDDTSPVIQGDRVVWVRTEDGVSTLYSYHGGDIAAVPGSSGARAPAIWGDNLAWLTGPEAAPDLQVLGSDGIPIKVNSSMVYDALPHLSSEYLVWTEANGSLEIQAWNLLTHQYSSLGSPLFNDSSPRTWGDSITWLQQNGDRDLKSWSAGLTWNVTSDDMDILDHDLWGDLMIWVAYDGAEWFLYTWDRSELQLLARSSEALGNPRISDGISGWIQGQGSAAELWLRQGNLARRITEDQIEDRALSVDRGMATWLHGQDVMLLKVDCGPDLDQDGVNGSQDNCPNLYNPNQENTDNDDLGDVCDPDDDNDGIGDHQDNCAFMFNPDQLDLDEDTIGDACDPDGDGDGFLATAYGGNDCDDLSDQVVPYWVVSEISSSLTESSAPQISGNTVVWSGRVGSTSDFEIYRYNGSNLFQVTQNETNDLNPRVRNGDIVWEQFDGTDMEVFLYSPVSGIRQITSNSLDDRAPEVGAMGVVWYGYDGHDYEIYLYDWDLIRQITLNKWNDYHPRLHGDIVVWRTFDGSDYEIYQYRQGVILPITSNNLDENVPVTSDGWVVWSAYDGEDSEIYLWDGETIRQLSNNNVDDLDPRTSQGRVVWRRYDGNDYEIIFFTGSVSYQITDNDVEDGAPDISGPRIVWPSRENPQADWDIFSHQAGTTVKVTDDQQQDLNPVVSGNRIAWKCNGRICTAVEHCGP